MLCRSLSDEITMQAVKAAAATIGSLSETEFDLRFNPDVFVKEVKHASSEVLSFCFFFANCYHLA